MCEHCGFDRETSEIILAVFKNDKGEVKFHAEPALYEALPSEDKAEILDELTEVTSLLAIAYRLDEFIKQATERANTARKN